MTISVVGTTASDSDGNKFDVADIGLKTQHGRSQAVVVTAAASSSNGIQTVSSTSFDLLTDDATFDTILTAADFTASAALYLYYKYEDADNLWSLSINTDGTVNFLAKASAATVIDATTTKSLKFAEGTWGRITVTLQRETATSPGALSVYQNGILMEAVSISKASTASISNTGNLYRFGTNAARSAGTVSTSSMFNRALSASDVLLLAINGVGEADKWAGITKTCDFSADADDFVAQDGTVAGNVDGISDGTTSKDDTLRLTVDNGASTHYIADTTNPVVGERYRVRGSYYIPAANSNVDGIQFYQEEDVALSSPLTVTGTWTAFDIELAVPITVADLRIYALDGDQKTFTDAGGNDVFYIADGMTIEKLGCTMSNEPTGIDASLQWKDSSTNKHHAMLPVAGATPLIPVKSWEIRGTNTYAGAHALQNIVGIDQAVFPANTPIYMEQWLYTITGATVEDIIAGDGNDVDHWVAITTGLAAGKGAFTIANAVDDGTNLKINIDPDANATCVISSVISGRVLEA